MPKFFLPAENIGDTAIVITGGDARHIAASLRMTKGDKLTVCDFSGHEYDCVIVSALPDTVRAEILSVSVNNTEPPYSVRLYQAAVKGDKFDVIVQKSVETGVSAVIPFISERCIARPDSKTFEKKRERLQRIATEAAKQCGRGIIPDIMPSVKYTEAVDQAARGDLGFICYEGADTTPLGRLLRSRKNIPRDIRFIIGSEGGFSAEEIKTAREKGLFVVGLGKRILRCETAPAFVLACLSYEYELTPE